MKNTIKTDMKGFGGVLNTCKRYVYARDDTNSRGRNNGQTLDTIRFSK